MSDVRVTHDVNLDGKYATIEYIDHELARFKDFNIHLYILLGVDRFILRNYNLTTKTDKILEIYEITPETAKQIKEFCGGEIEEVQHIYYRMNLDKIGANKVFR